LIGLIIQMKLCLPKSKTKGKLSRKSFVTIVKKPCHFAHDCQKKKADTKRVQKRHEKPEKGRASGNFGSNKSYKDTSEMLTLLIWYVVNQWHLANNYFVAAPCHISMAERDVKTEIEMLKQRY